MSVGGEAASQKDLVWVSLEEYSSSVEGATAQQPPSSSQVMEGTDQPDEPPSMLLLNGIQLKQRGENTPFALFSYCPGPMSEGPMRVEWKIISQDPIVSQHVLIYKLKHGDSIPDIVSKLDSNYTAALILVNNDEGYLISRDFQWEGMAQPSFPVCILTQEDGDKLIGMVTQQETGEVLARVESRSMSEAEAKRGKSPSPEELSLTLERAKGKKTMLRAFHKPRVDLKKRIKEIMAPNPSHPPMCVSENQEMFQKIMDEFLNYENAAKGKPHDASDNSRVFQKLNKFLQTPNVFNKDCVFYVVLAYRVFKYQTAYLCDEHAKFIHECISKFEDMDIQARVDAILKFIEGGNFTIVFDEEFPSSPVFQVMERACIALMKESFKWKTRVLSSLSQQRVIYSRMLWLSVSLKFKSVTGPSDGSKIWYDNMTKDSHLFVLDEQSISDLVAGVKYGKQIDLPIEAMFGVEQLSQLMAVQPRNNSIRPFYQLTAVLSKMEQFMFVSEDFLKHIIVNLRAPYHSCLGSATKSLDKLSMVGTLLAAVQDGLTFLDTIVEIWTKKKWNHASYEQEMLNWVYLLLGAIDITSDKTTSYLKEFQSQTEHPVCASFQRQIREKVVAEVRDNYPRLTLNKFTRLFVNFYIWPLEVVQEYLQSYKIPARQNIKDDTMVTLFKTIIERFSGAENHGFIADFLVTYRDHYVEEKRPFEFIVHILSIYIPGLFSIDSTKPSTAALSVQKTFKTMLREHIQRNRLTQQIISHVTAVWKSISEMSEFQLLVLSVLQDELVSESRNLQTPIKDTIIPILEDTIGHLSYDASWLTEVTPHHKFAFGVVSVCCSRVVVNETLDWMESYGDIIARLGKIYQSYCSSKGLLKEECLLSEIPEDIKKLDSPEILTYFQWIVDVQRVMALWKGKFPSMLLNYDEILEYLKYYNEIMAVSQAVNATPLVLDMEVVQKSHQDYQKLFEALNCHLIKYIPQHPEHGWRLLRTVLTEYGIDIPQKILQYLSQLVIYPNESREANLGDTMLHSLKPGLTGDFNPGHNVSLTLTKEVTLLLLKKMVVDLDAFLAPIKDNIDLLTYFFLRRSYIFDTYLRYQLRKHDAIANGETIPTSHLSISRIRSVTGSLMGSLRKSTVATFKGISLDLLATALTDTKQLLVKIVEGTAVYTDVTAGGNLDLEKMDVDTEFQVLVDYTKYLNVTIENDDGLRGIQCMLELFQYITDIQNIFNTCDQYQLDGCLADPTLAEVKSIADKLEDVESRNQLTPKEAIEKNNMIVNTLRLKKKGLGHDRQCLQIFPAVSDSSEFYQLLKEKDFYGEEGQKVFRQKYELITAQLQHEEYNELVLNHLYAAYKCIMPFLDKEQNFEKLMQQVSEMNNVKGFKELHTVNKNIHLVRLWFSRAEEDTLEVVPDQLDAILSTGEYKFIFVNTPDGVKAQVFLEYRPPHSMATAVTSPNRLTESQYNLQLSGSTEELSIRGLESSSTVCESLRREMSPPPMGIRYIKWTSEQIRDFEQRLGFLDPDKSLRVNINRFLALNQSAYKLLDLYQRLKDLGHPLYIETEPKRKPSLVTVTTDLPAFRDFPCSLSMEETQQLVIEAETQLKDWNFIVSALHTQFETLLFFSIPKLLHLHQKISNGQVDSVAGEVSFLFKNNAVVYEKLKSSVKALLPSMITEAEACNAPMEVVGKFLHKLLNENDMKRYALQPRHPYRQPARIVSAQSSAILHSCHGLSRVQLMSLIINCYNGVPESFQLFRCHSSTSEDELNLFLNRVSSHAFQYMIVGVEKLPYQLQELLLQFQLKATPFSIGSSNSDTDVTCLNFVETGPSVLREMPWITVKEHKGGQSLNSERARKITRQGVMAFEDFHCITLVYGHAGDGKSHFIRTRLRNRLSHMILNIPVSEGFTPLSAIKKLQSLPMDTRGNCIYFNFTMLPPSDTGVHSDEKTQYNQLMDVVNWFFFDLLILGYVEDPTSGESFRLPGGLSWAVFVEVPSRGQQVKPVDALSKFLEDVPTLGLVCTKEFVEPNRPYVVDKDVQLVCKYLKAYETGGKNGIDKLYRDPRRGSKTNPPVKFSTEKDLEPEECLTLLEKYTPDHMRTNKTTQKLFVQYMKRRCYFLDNLPAYNFNTGSAEMTVDAKGKRVMNNTKKLGSTLMKAFLKEVAEFCDPSSKADWSKKPHQQLIYDTVDGGSSIGLISLNTEQIPKEELDNFRDISIALPSMMDLHTRQWLDDYLSRALNVPLDHNGLLKIIDDSQYVLTLDYTLKMLNIHERHECGMPVIIEGETGVGKTALVEVLSKLWNSAYLNSWRKTRENLLEFIVKKMSDLVKMSPERVNACFEITSRLRDGKEYTEEDIEFLCELPDTTSPSAQFHSVLCKEVLKLKDNPVLSLLEHPTTESDRSFNFLFRAAEYKNNPKATAELVYGVLTTKVKSAFYKLNVHAALKPAEILAFFKEISDHANEIQDAYKMCKEPSGKMAVPSITVFLDEINTASCLGLFKEIIVDKTIDGVDVPDNVFILGACNPHRGDSLAAMATDATWISSNYYVRSLHPTLDMLKWDYGSLDEYQERDYINAKLRLMDKDMSNVELASLAELIVSSQNMLRAFAFRQLKTLGVDEVDALRCSKSCVSQRDIQRVFTFYEWLVKFYNKHMPHGSSEDYNRCAIMVSLAVVYYMRLNTDYRQEFGESMDKSAHLNKGYKFSDTFNRELDWFISQMDIPKGIAKTLALKENIFSIILCSMTSTPLIIVGPPGCSKTLSFNLVTANLRGQESKVKLFRDTTLFKSLDPHYYQCSRRTTSNEIQTVFSRAINRQNTYNTVPLPISCVVFMDEAGLPEESLESLKVLHYHLDRRDVSFVAISNHMLDAAKTNRAVSLFRSEPSIDELKTLAKGCLCDTPLNPPAELKKDIDTIVKFCPVYHSFMEKPEFRRFFGLRDFIHFINYLERHRNKGITEHLVLRALERNFNGHKMFETICKEFLGAMNSNLHRVQRNNILNILKESLSDRPQEELVANPNISMKENEVRYKLIIDSSEDNSLLRLLFSFDILKEKETRTYVCSDFPGDSHQQMINTIAAIRHSAAAGHTVIMSQTDELHESFYDLFNQRFRRIDDPKTGPRFYANIAIGAHHKPCRVHPSFQCVVVVKQSEIDRIPHPFLNRFEKYSLTHKILLDAVLSYQPAYLRSVLRKAKEKVTEFIRHVGGSESLYGIHDDTLDSLMLSLLPPVGFQEFLETDKPAKEEEIPQDLKGRDVEVFLVRRLLRALRKRAGFRLPHFAREELAADAECVMRLVARDSQFGGQLAELTVKDVLKAIPEALQGLYHTSTKDRRTDLSINACMVISVFLQWLVRHICKRLMQLMTTEALTTRYKTLPHYYTETYLKHQSHFNLQLLIDRQLQVMQLDDAFDRSTTGTANRLLLVTRSSALIHQLPARYPAPNGSTHLSSDYDSLIKKTVYYYAEDVCVYKLSDGTTQANINELLNSFWNNKKQRILLLVANMKETSREMISHLRVMIEENDTGEKLKLFVVLLHFPPSMFSSPCYPILFSNTWDHHYLDIIGQNPTGQVIDICEWFSLCCSYLSARHSKQERVPLNLSSILYESIPIISSRVFFGKNEEAPFNCPMEVPNRNKALKKFFDSGVGEILCEKFLSYWEPGVMLEYLEKAAALATTVQTNTLSITDSLQTILRDTFFDYIVHMVSKLNEDMNIDILMDPSCTESTRKLFLSLLRVYPMPKLSQIKTLSGFANSISNVEAFQNTIFCPKFPFYRLVSSGIEKIIEQTRKEINQRLDTLHEFPDPAISLTQMSIASLPKVIEDKSHLVTNMQKDVEYAITQIIESKENNPLKVAIEAMLHDADLFKRYSEAFTHQKLRLGAGTAGISYKLLRLTFLQLHPDQDFLTRLGLLHICMHVYQLDLARLVQVLRPLDILLDMAAVIPSDPYTFEQPSPTASFLTAVRESGDLLGQPGDLSKYVLKILFGALVGSLRGQDSSPPEENLSIWYEVYKDVMSMPAVRDYLYQNLNELSETQHNIMHCVYLVILALCDQEETDLFSLAEKVFSLLFNAHFDDKMELKGGSPPRLQEISNLLTREICGTNVEVTLQSFDPVMRHIFEGLFEHFFSPHRHSHSADNMLYFLKLVNLNVQWKLEGGGQVKSASVHESLIGDSPMTRHISLSTSPEEYQDGKGCIPIGVYKHYLSVILDKADTSNVGTPAMTSLVLYKPWVREMVGQILVEAQRKVKKATPYIPVFYQAIPTVTCPPSSENKLMQQPLAHLYFITVFHHLLSNNFDLSGLVRVASAIDTDLKNEKAKDKQVLLYIEQQAVIQAVIQQLAKCLSSPELNGISAIAQIITDINLLLDDRTLGGGTSGGHGIALALNLFKELGSVSKFANFLKPESMNRDFSCLVNLSSKIDIPNEHHLFPFLFYVSKGNPLKDLYVNVGQAMLRVHTSGGKKTQPLLALANEWSQGTITISLPDGQDFHGDKSGLFKMVFWLNTYQKFFSEKRASPHLAEMLRNQEQLMYIVQPPEINKLIQCFLDPSLMLQEQSSAQGDIASYQDPIYALFNPDKNEDTPSDAALRDALVNLIAVVIASPPASTHLWYHMFASDQLQSTHIAGFMHDSPIGEGLFYDSGVQLTDIGLYKMESYLKHALRGTLSLQSLYLLLWANAGAFCVGLLTDPDAETKMLGKVFPENFSVRHYCIKQLRTMWNHLSSNLGISIEERSFLVSRCMWNLLKIGCGSQNGIVSGRFTTIVSLNIYESKWHNNIFLPVWSSLKDAYGQYANLYIHQIFKDMQTLEAHYPFFPTESALAQSLLSQTDIGDYVSNTEHILSQFALYRRQLEVGGELLSILVEFYQWLHQELAYVITRKDAEGIPVSRAVRVLVKSYSPDEGERLQQLYKSLKDLYNCYKELTSSSIPTLEDNTPLLHVLSCSSNEEDTPDILYTVISEIITTHNNFLVKAENAIRADKNSSLQQYLPQEFSRVHPTEFTEQNCLVQKTVSLHGQTDFVQLICKHSAIPAPTLELTGSHTSLPGYLPTLINLKALQEDIFAIQLAGKPLIGPPQSLRTRFDFRDSKLLAKENLSAIEADVLTISDKLLDEFKTPLDDGNCNQLKNHFHSAPYSTIMETVSGLRGVAGHLIKKLMGVSQSELLDLQQVTLADFLSTVFNTQEPLKSITGSKKSIFHEIGINSLSINQFNALESIPLVNLHDALKWFVTWASQGWYEYCALPLSMKAPLSAPDRQAIQSLPDTYTQSNAQLLTDLKGLKLVLNHFESNSTITTTALKSPQLSIVEFLSNVGEGSKHETLLNHIPSTVLIVNYVAFHVAIKQLIIQLQRTMSSECLSITPHKKSWEDFIEDLWEQNLSNFRQGKYTYAVVTTSDQKKRVYTLKNINRSDEDLLNDLMTAGISETELLSDTDNEDSSSTSDCISLSDKSPVTTPFEPPAKPIYTGQLEDPETSFATAMSAPKKESVTRRLAESYTPQQVQDFLSSIGLEEYIPAFKDLDISGDVLLSAGQGKGLEDLGVKNPLHRLKISLLFRRQLEGIGKIAKRYPVEEVVRFLNANKMNKFVEMFEEHKIDGEMLMEASDDVLAELGIANHIQKLALKSNFKKYITPRFTTL